jgi:hypothetical protein
MILDTTTFITLFVYLCLYFFDTRSDPDPSPGEPEQPGSVWIQIGNTTRNLPHFFKI